MVPRKSVLPKLQIMPKEDGSLFEEYQKTYNPNSHHYQLSQALGGAWQDIGCEGAYGCHYEHPTVLGVFELVIVWYKCRHILMRSLFISLQSVEMIAQMRVLAILHISICIPTWWLAGNCQELKDADFGVFDMGHTVDLMESAFENIVLDGSMLLDKEFMMDDVKPIVTKVDAFSGYLQYIFEQKESFIVGSRKSKDKWLPFDELQAELFYPTLDYIRQTHSVSCHLAVVAANAFLAEFRDPRKATSNWLFSNGGVRSLAMASEDDCKATFGMDASTSILESVHATSTVGLKVAGTI